MSAEERLEGDLHDVLSDLVYERLPDEVRRALDVGYRHKRTEAVEEVYEAALDEIEEQIEDLEDWYIDLEPAVCSACGGSGGGRPPYICRKCGGSGRPSGGKSRGRVEYL